MSFLLLFFVSFCFFSCYVPHDTDTGTSGIDGDEIRCDDKMMMSSHQMATQLLPAPSPKVWTATTMLLSGCETQWAFWSRPKDEKLNDVTKEESDILQLIINQCLIKCEPKSALCCDDQSCWPMLRVLPEASVTYGTLMCLECSGQHRSLGVGSSDWAPHDGRFAANALTKLLGAQTQHAHCTDFRCTSPLSDPFKWIPGQRSRSLPWTDRGSRFRALGIWINLG